MPSTTHAVRGPRPAAPSGRPLRVCHIAYSFYESDNRVMRYVQSLAARGDQVDVLSLRAPEKPKYEAAGNVRLHRIQRRSPTEKRAWTYLLKILWFWVKSSAVISALHLRRRFDVVHVHNVPDFLVFTAWLPKLSGAAIILDIHDILPELYAGKFSNGQASSTFRALLAVERASCAFADHVIIANHLWYERLIERSVPREKCTAILNYPDLAVFTPAAAKSRSPYVILYPGSLNYHQGLDIAVRAFALAAPEMPEAEFHIYGRGPTLSDLMRLAVECGVGDRVHFKPSVGLAEVARIMAAAHLGVVPKRADGFGNEAFSTKTLEFMACGVPIIVARTRIDAHYFNDSLVRFFEPGNERDLAVAMAGMYRDRDRLDEQVRAAEAYAGELSWQAHGADYVNIVDTLVARAWPGQPEVHGNR